MYSIRLPRSIAWASVSFFKSVYLASKHFPCVFIGHKIDFREYDISPIEATHSLIRSWELDT